MDIKKMSYEESIDQLEEIILKLESDELSLEESIGFFRKANLLYEHCKELLDTAEGEIKVILEDEDNGNLIESDFNMEG